MENNPNNQNNGGGFFNKNPIVAFAIFAIIMILIFRSFAPGEMSELVGPNSRSVSYSDLKRMIKQKEISNLAIGQNTIKAQTTGGATYSTRKVADPTLVPLLEENGVSYSAYSETSWLSDIIFSWIVPIFIFFAIWMFLASRMQKNMSSGILGMGSSKKLVNSERPKVKFSDVAGVEEAKEEVKEIVDFLKNPERYIN